MEITAIPAARQVSPLAKALTEARTLGIPAWAVAREAAVSEAALSMIARGRLRPAPETAQRIADALGRSVAELFPSL